MPYGNVLADLMTTSDGVNTGGLYGFKNRIINGGMRIDQRNGGASVATSSGTTVFTVDRFPVFYSQTSKFTAQQNAGSVTPPAGFTNYLGITSSSAYSVLTGDYFLVGHRVEGFNAADLAWGTANAQTVTLSFWVRSSLTGTFGGAINNNAQNRSYPFTYTINAANTWEKETITIAGDTSGTWLTNNAIGLTVFLGLGAGATYSGTAGSWSGSTFFSATGATSVVGTNGATFFITGVQLERGSTATSFDVRSQGTELALCQRYYFRLTPTSGPEPVSMGYAYNSASSFGVVNFPVTMRIRPTALEQSGTASDYRVVYGASLSTNCTIAPVYSNANTSMGQFVFTTAAVMTANAGTLNQSNTTNGYLAWSAEL